MSAASVAPVATPTRRGAWVAALLLMAAYALSWMDRSLPGVLIEPMKASLHVSDTKIALVTGFAFALCHATLTLPLSWVADRWDRARLIMIGVVVWSLMTAACAFAATFATLFVCRMGVGLGEAVLLPAAYSLISDLFSREQRPKGLMLFVLGSPIGSAAALSGGGALHAYVRSASPAWAMGLEPWRAVFLAVGVIGLVIAVMMIWLPEPRRGAAAATAGANADQAAPSDAVGFFAYLAKAAFFLVPVTIGVTLYNIYVNGTFAWLAPLFSRNYGWSLPQIGAALGPAVLISGVAAAPIGAWLIGAVGRWRRRDAAVTVIVGSAVVLLPLAVLSPLAPSGGLAFAGIVTGLVVAMIATVAAPAALINSAPAPMRARVSALYLFIANLIGSGCGAAVYALSTDYLFKDPAKLNLSMATVSGALLIAILISLVIADRGYDRVMRLAGETLQEHAGG